MSFSYGLSCGVLCKNILFIPIWRQVSENPNLAVGLKPPKLKKVRQKHRNDSCGFSFSALVHVAWRRLSKMLLLCWDDFLLIATMFVFALSLCRDLINDQINSLPPNIFSSHKALRHLWDLVLGMIGKDYQSTKLIGASYFYMNACSCLSSR